MRRFVIHGETAATLVAGELVRESMYFELTPMPEDEYEFAVKDDRADTARRLIQARGGVECIETPMTDSGGRPFTLGFDVGPMPTPPREPREG